MKEKKSKKPFYKKWWVWVLAVVALASLYQTMTGKRGSAQVPDTVLSTQTPVLATEDPVVPFETPAVSSEAPAEQQTETVEVDAVDPLAIKGRGYSDSGRSEPQYENLQGYVAIYDSEISKTDACFITPWITSTYEKDKQFYVESGTIEHKTPVTVISQELQHEGYGNYSGHLLVETVEGGDLFIVNVKDFITVPYWDSENIADAVSIGCCIAEFNQASDYYPVNRNNNKVELADGTLVLAVGKTGHYGGNGPDANSNSVEAIVFKEWESGYGGVPVFFNPQDLIIVY